MFKILNKLIYIQLNKINEQKVIVIGITGPTRAGKTT